MRGLPKHLRGLSPKELRRRWWNASTPPRTPPPPPPPPALIPPPARSLLYAPPPSPSVADLWLELQRLSSAVEAAQKPPWPGAKRVKVISGRLSMEGQEVNGMYGWGIHLPDEPGKWYVSGDDGWLGSWPLAEVEEVTDVEPPTNVAARTNILLSEALDNGPAAYHCNECNRDFRTRAAFRMHLDVAHDTQLPPRRNSGGTSEG